MKIYFAPMEGITSLTYRNTHYDYYKGIESYYTPFITVKKHHKLRIKEKQDISHELNKTPVIPQILSKNSTDTLWAIDTFPSDEININLGCPSPTVTKKGKGSAMLEDLHLLEKYFDDIFTHTKKSITIKTRIGYQDTSQYKELFELFNKYPFKSIIVHPRIASDMYQKPVRLELFDDILNISHHHIIYNGDIFNKEDYLTFTKHYPMIEDIMIGRGLLAKPFLVDQIHHQPIDKDHFYLFVDALLKEYQDILPNEKTVLFKMKELWHYMAINFEDSKKPLKKILKSQNIHTYLKNVDSLFTHPFKED